MFHISLEWKVSPSRPHLGQLSARSWPRSPPRFLHFQHNRTEHNRTQSQMAVCDFTASLNVVALCLKKTFWHEKSVVYHHLVDFIRNSFVRVNIRRSMVAWCHTAWCTVTADTVSRLMFYGIAHTLCHFCTFQKFNFYLLLLILSFFSFFWRCCCCCCPKQSFHKYFFFFSCWVLFLFCVLHFHLQIRWPPFSPCLYYVILAVPNFFLSLLLHHLRGALCFLAAFLSFFIFSTVNRAEHVSLDKTYFVFLLFLLGLLHLDYIKCVCVCHNSRLKDIWLIYCHLRKKNKKCI